MGRVLCIWRRELRMVSVELVEYFVNSHHRYLFDYIARSRRNRRWCRRFHKPRYCRFLVCIYKFRHGRRRRFRMVGRFWLFLGRRFTLCWRKLARCLPSGQGHFPSQRKPNSFSAAALQMYEQTSGYSFPSVAQCCVFGNGQMKSGALFCPLHIPMGIFSGFSSSGNVDKAFQYFSYQLTLTRTSTSTTNPQLFILPHIAF